MENFALEEIPFKLPHSICGEWENTARADSNVENIAKTKEHPWDYGNETNWNSQKDNLKSFEFTTTS